MNTQSVEEFRDRVDAGRKLARALLHLKESQPVVLGLPRGGVPVAFEVAVALAAPLDVVLVRKIGAPGQPELGLGAVVAATHYMGVTAAVIRLGAERAKLADDSLIGELWPASSVEKLPSRQPSWIPRATVRSMTRSKCVRSLVSGGASPRRSWATWYDEA